MSAKLMYVVIAASLLIVSAAHAIKVHQDLNMQSTNLINMGGNKITNLAPGTAAMDAVNYAQLTNVNNAGVAALNSLSNYVRDTMITSVANYAYLTGQVNDTYVNVTGDTMTGPLTINNNLAVNGKITAQDIYALTQTVLNITVSNQCIVATNLQVRGIIAGVQATNLNDAAVNYAQLTNAMGGATPSDVYLRRDGDNAMTGNLPMGNNRLINLASPVAATDGATRGYVDSATNAVGGVWDSRWVNVDGDTMTGPLTVNNSVTINGKLRASDIYAETQTVINITVSNQCIVATNMSVYGPIALQTESTNGNAAVTYNQLTNAVGGTSSADLYVKKAGDTMTGQLAINAGGLDINAGGATVSGGVTVENTGLTVTAGGATVNGGNVVVNNNGDVTVNGGQVQINGAANSIRRNGAGKIVIYSDGQPALELE